MNLPKPKYCDQDWNQMMKVEGGRLCQKCSNTIVDFSKMTWSEIREMQGLSNNTTCGLYTKKQLDNWNVEKPTRRGARQFFLAFSTILVSLSYLKSNKAFGQETKTEQTALDT